MYNTPLDLELDFEFQCNYERYLACERARAGILEDKYKAWLNKEFPGLNLNDSDVSQADRNYYWQWFLNECC